MNSLTDSSSFEDLLREIDLSRDATEPSHFNISESFSRGETSTSSPALSAQLFGDSRTLDMETPRTPPPDPWNRISASSSFNAGNMDSGFNWGSLSELNGSSNGSFEPAVFDDNQMWQMSTPSSPFQDSRPAHQPYGILHPPPSTASSSGPSNFIPSVPMSINIVQEHVLNFTNCFVQFTVQVWNLPLHIPLTSIEMEATAETPGKRFIPCRGRLVRKEDGCLADTYKGSFRTYEFGLHHIHAYLRISPEYWNFNNDYGIIVETVPILVSRNYYLLSLRSPFRVLQVDYVKWTETQYSHSALLRKMRQAKNQRETQHQPVRPPFESKVWGLACDRVTNRLYYTDRYGHLFTCVDSEGQVIFKYGNTGRSTKAAMLNCPTGICVDEVNRRLFISDKDHHRIISFTLDGQFITTFGAKGYANGEFNYPWDVDVSPSGEQILVSDSRNKRIQLFDKEGNFLNKFSIFETKPFEVKNNFEYPRGVTFNSQNSGVVYVTDFNSHNIVEVSLDMQSHKKILPDGKLRRPQGIVADDFGNLLVCDSRNKALRHVNPSNSKIICTIKNVGGAALNNIDDITLMSQGKVAVINNKAKITIF